MARVTEEVNCWGEEYDSLARYPLKSKNADLEIGVPGQDVLLPNRYYTRIS
jgi:hypothetical protein